MQRAGSRLVAAGGSGKLARLWHQVQAPSSTARGAAAAMLTQVKLEEGGCTQQPVVLRSWQVELSGIPAPVRYAWVHRWWVSGQRKCVCLDSRALLAAKQAALPPASRPSWGAPPSPAPPSCMEAREAFRAIQLKPAAVSHSNVDE